MNDINEQAKPTVFRIPTKDGGSTREERRLKGATNSTAASPRDSTSHRGSLDVSPFSNTMESSSLKQHHQRRESSIAITYGNHNQHDRRGSDSSLDIAASLFSSIQTLQSLDGNRIRSASTEFLTANGTGSDYGVMNGGRLSNSVANSTASGIGSQVQEMLAYMEVSKYVAAQRVSAALASGTQGSHPMMNHDTVEQFVQQCQIDALHNGHAANGINSYLPPTTTLLGNIKEQDTTTLPVISPHSNKSNLLRNVPIQELLNELSRRQNDEQSRQGTSIATSQNNPTNSMDSSRCSSLDVLENLDRKISHGLQIPTNNVALSFMNTISDKGDASSLSSRDALSEVVMLRNRMGNPQRKQPCFDDAAGNCGDTHSEEPIMLGVVYVPTNDISETSREKTSDESSHSSIATKSTMLQRLPSELTTRSSCASLDALLSVFGDELAQFDNEDDTGTKPAAKGSTDEAKQQEDTTKGSEAEESSAKKSGEDDDKPTAFGLSFLDTLPDKKSSTRRKHKIDDDASASSSVVFLNGFLQKDANTPSVADAYQRDDLSVSDGGRYDDDKSKTSNLTFLNSSIYQADAVKRMSYLNGSISSVAAKGGIHRLWPAGDTPYPGNADPRASVGSLLPMLNQVQRPSLYEEMQRTHQQLENTNVWLPISLQNQMAAVEAAMRRNEYSLRALAMQEMQIKQAQGSQEAISMVLSECTAPRPNLQVSQAANATFKPVVKTTIPQPQSIEPPIEEFLRKYGEAGEKSRVTMFDAIEETEKSLNSLQDWDKEQGLRKCHSRTVVRTRRSRAHVKAFLTGVPPPPKPKKRKRGKYKIYDPE